MRFSKRSEIDALLRGDFYAFVQRCFLTLNPGATFVPNWHLEALAFHLELVRESNIHRLMINLPPRHLKSLTVSLALPAFLLGHDPTLRVIVASYGADLAVKLSNDFRSILDSDWYKRIFPDTRISKNTEYEVVTTRGGFRLATTVGGALTGRGGGLVIIDDPLKASDALSDSKREQVNEWYRGTLLTRLDDKVNGAIIVVMQRLHDDDICGMLLRGPDAWTHLSLPAIAQTEERIKIGKRRYHRRRVGALLHPQREPFTVLESLRAQIGPDNFAAQYLQAPVAPDGNMIKRDWVQRYDHLPARDSSSCMVQSWDTASKDGEESSFSVCTTWLIIQGTQYYLVDVMRGRSDYPVLKERAISHAKLHKPATILVEDTGVGTALIAELRNQGFTVIPIKVEHNKRIRMSIQSAKFSSGQVFFPRQAPWLHDLEAELFAFPGSRYDDQVDSISQALAHEIKGALWNEKSLDGLSRFVDGSFVDRGWGRRMGRPW